MGLTVVLAVEVTEHHFDITVSVSNNITKLVNFNILITMLKVWNLLAKLFHTSGVLYIHEHKGDRTGISKFFLLRSVLCIRSPYNESPLYFILKVLNSNCLLIS